jgi:hypothetical protein
MMKLMTKELEKKLPGLYATEKEKDPTALVKYFSPDSNWTWYGTEYDPGSKVFFGLVIGFEAELGYFSLMELESVTGRLGLPVERDLHWNPKRISEIRKEHSR